MKISLIRCPCINLPYPPPIGLGYISSFLKAAGHEVFIFDLNVEFFHQAQPEEKEKWSISNLEDLIILAKGMASRYNELIDYYVKKILNTQSRIIGFSVWDSNIFFSLRLAREIKRKDKDRVVVFGGPECFPRWSGRFLIQSQAVDAVVYGEGEETLREIASSLEKSGRIEFPSGAIIKKENSRIIDCGPRQPIENLDTLPFPDFTGFPLDKYLTNKLPLTFNRGCPMRCTYCAAPGTIPKYRWRSAESIFEEIKYQLRKYSDKDGFDSCSPALNFNLNEISKLCDFILKEKIEFEWSGYAIIDPRMSIGLLRKMKKAGCFGLNFGLENGSQRVIDGMRKGFQVKEAERVLRNAYSVGMEIVVNFIIGFPGETEEDFQENLEFISRNWDYISFVGSMDACWVEPYSYIYEHPDEFDIVIGSNAYNWHTIDGGNTPQIRLDRKKRFEEFISTLGKKVSFPKPVIS